MQNHRGISGWVGICKDRFAISRAFIAKAVYGFATTRVLMEGLKNGAEPGKYMRI
jgi:hypothetical protein